MFRAHFEMNSRSLMIDIQFQGTREICPGLLELLKAEMTESHHIETVHFVSPGFVLTYIGEFQDRWPDMMAASVVVSLPIVVMFTLFQKQLVSGLTAGAIKG